MIRDEWKEQYLRMIRWKKRLDELCPSSESFDFHKQRDYIYAFFQSCWHLKDWLKDCGLNKKVVEGHAHKKGSRLETCGIIANSTKHCHYSWDGNTLEEDRKAHRFHQKTIGGVLTDSSTGGHTYTADSDISCTPELYEGQSVETFALLKFEDMICSIEGVGDYSMKDLADKCIVEWDEFLRNNGLNPPT